MRRTILFAQSAIYMIPVDGPIKIDVGPLNAAETPTPLAKLAAPFPARVETTGEGSSDATRMRCPVNSVMKSEPLESATPHGLESVATEPGPFTGDPPASAPVPTTVETTPAMRTLIL
jgi:hypothetical protein